MERENPHDVNPYDSKGYKRTRRHKKDRPNPRDVKTHTLNLPDTIPSNQTMMQFYYRRGNKYFFRSKTEKLMVETTSIKDKLKRGDRYLVSYE